MTVVTVVLNKSRRRLYLSSHAINRFCQMYLMDKTTASELKSKLICCLMFYKRYVTRDYLSSCICRIIYLSLSLTKITFDIELYINFIAL